MKITKKRHKEKKKSRQKKYTPNLSQPKKKTMFPSHRW